MRGEEVDADADEAAPAIVTLILVDEAVLDARLGAPLLGSLQQSGSGQPDRHGGLLYSAMTEFAAHLYT